MPRLILDQSGNESWATTAGKLNDMFADLYQGFGGQAARRRIDQSGNESWATTAGKINAMLAELYPQMLIAEPPPMLDMSGNDAWATNIGKVNAVTASVYAAAAAVKAWTPDQLAGSVLGWWDAQDAATLSLAGDAVTTWTDKKNGYALTQASSGFKPLLRPSEINGKPGVYFDGTDDYLNMESQPFPNGADESEVWALVDSTAPATEDTIGVIFRYGGTSVQSVRGFDRRFGARGIVRASIGSGTAFAPYDDGFVGRHVLRVQVRPADGQLYVNGQTRIANVRTPTVGTTRVRMGAITANTPSSFFRGGINTLLVTSPLSNNQAALLTQHLKLRGGIA